MEYPEPDEYRCVGRIDQRKLFAVEIRSVTKDGFAAKTDWFKGYRDVVFEMIKEDAKKKKGG